MRIWRHAAAGLLSAGLAGSWVPPALAQPVPVAEADDAHALARAFLQKMGGAKMMDGILLSTRGVMVAALQQQGKTAPQAEEIADQFMMPEFRARAPELMARFEDVLVADFTADELRAVVEGQVNDARRSAAAKAGLMQPHFAAAGQEWGSRVGTDVFERNRTALEKLGLDATGIVQ